MKKQGPGTAPPEARPCERCGRPVAICVCDRVTPVATRHRVLILQHPQEQDVALGTAGLVTATMPKAVLRVGLSWGSLAHALGEREANPGRWAVVFPQAKKVDLEPAPDAQHLLVDPRGHLASPRRISGIVVLDGTWSQAKALWWRNAWLLKLGRMSLYPREASIYGSLRKEPRKQFISTLESVALALSALGEEPEVEASLLRLFRTLAQRARDARKQGLRL